MNAKKIKTKLAQVHALEPQYGRVKAFRMVRETLSAAEAKILGHALNLTDTEIES